MKQQNLHKMLFTDAGLRLKEEIQLELENEDPQMSLKALQKKIPQENLKVEESFSFFEQNKQNDLTRLINQSINKTIAPQVISKPKSVSQLILADITKDKITSFVKSQTQKISQSIADPQYQKFLHHNSLLDQKFQVLNTTSSGHNEVLPHLTNHNNFNINNYDFNNSKISQFNYTSNQNHSNLSSNRTHNYAEDEIFKEQCNQIVHAKCQVERMIQRHDQTIKRIEGVEQQVKNKYREQINEISEVNLLAPQHAYEIQTENQDLYDTIQQKTFYNQRLRDRVGRIMNSQYQPVWNQICLPKLTDQYKILSQNYYYPHTKQSAEQQNRNRTDINDPTIDQAQANLEENSFDEIKSTNKFEKVQSSQSISRLISI